MTRSIGARFKNGVNSVLRRFGYEMRKVGSRSQPTSGPTGVDRFTTRPRPAGFDARREMFRSLEGMTSLRELERLYTLARDVGSGCIVEVGSYRGRSTVALALGSFDGHGVPVFAVEPHESFSGVFGGEFGPEDRAAFFETMLATGAWEVVRLVNLSSEVVAPGWSHEVELLWLDGDHAYEAVSRDLRSWEPHLSDRCVLALDDTVADSGPARVVAELVASGLWRVDETVERMTVLRRA
jgi:hypothetical protein